MFLSFVFFGIEGSYFLCDKYLWVFFVYYRLFNIYEYREGSIY